MSKTVSVGVVGPRHWVYMASVMAERLQQMVTAGKTAPAQIPPGVYYDAREFYKLVLEAAGDDTPINPPASINAYALAADAVRSVRANASRADVELMLGQQKTLLDDLQQQRAFNEEELKTLLSLRAFFLWLKQEGESEAYERSAGYEVPVGFRMA